METTNFDDPTRTSTAAADRLRDEVRPAAAAFTDQFRSAVRELPTPGVDVQGQQPWAAHTNPAGYQSARPTELRWTPGRCSCGRRPVQWLDSPQGPRTVPYCGRPLSEHHGPEIEAAAWQTPEPIEPAAGETQLWEDKTAGADPEPATVVPWLADDVNGCPQPCTGRIDKLAGGDRR